MFSLFSWGTTERLEGRRVYVWCLCFVSLVFACLFYLSYRFGFLFPPPPPPPLSAAAQLSSCQIYNVEKRIQEDHLQQLALFAEYGRMALNKEQAITASEGTGDGEGGGDSADPTAAAAAGIDLGKQDFPSFKKGDPVLPSAVGFAAKAKANADARRTASVGEGKGAVGTKEAGVAAGAAAGAVEDVDGVAVSQDWKERPFQRLEFLVRDWQV